MKFDTTQLLEKVIALNASDLLLSVGSPPVVRINRKLQALQDISALMVGDIEFLLTQVMEREQKELFEVNKELDFSVALGNKARFRVNAFYQKGYPSVAMRLIPLTIPTLEELHIPKVVTDFCELRQGLVLVVGPTGHGKSTTIASMIDRINETRAEHILTVEDPIEYIFSNKQSLIDQREMFLDTHSWDVALRSVLRQDPNIVVIGEMRDTDTLTSALQIAETGHLVFTTLHTNSAAQSVERVISSFPQNKQDEVRQQFAQVVEVIVSQRLLPSLKRGVVPAVEVMVANDAIRNLIREGKTHMIENVISTNLSSGMMTLDRSLAMLVSQEEVDIADALKFSNHPDELRRLVKEGRFK